MATCWSSSTNMRSSSVRLAFERGRKFIRVYADRHDSTDLFQRLDESLRNTSTSVQERKLNLLSWLLVRGNDWYFSICFYPIHKCLQCNENISQVMDLLELRLSLKSSFRDYSTQLLICCLTTNFLIKHMSDHLFQVY